MSPTLDRPILNQVFARHCQKADKFLACGNTKFLCPVPAEMWLAHLLFPAATVCEILSHFYCKPHKVRRERLSVEPPSFSPNTCVPVITESWGQAQGFNQQLDLTRL